VPVIEFSSKDRLRIVDQSVYFNMSACGASSRRACLLLKPMAKAMK